MIRFQSDSLIVDQTYFCLSNTQNLHFIWRFFRFIRAQLSSILFKSLCLNFVSKKGIHFIEEKKQILNMGKNAWKSVAAWWLAFNQTFDKIWSNENIIDKRLDISLFLEETFSLSVLRISSALFTYFIRLFFFLLFDPFFVISLLRSFIIKMLDQISTQWIHSEFFSPRKHQILKLKPTSSKSETFRYQSRHLSNSSIH